MGLRQFVNSVEQIVANPHVATGRGVAKHLQWQVRKLFNLFPFRQQFSGSKIIASHRQCSVSALIHSQGLYDYNNMRLVSWLLRDGGTFFDVGANIGPYTLLASEQPKAQVFAFEPHPTTFRLLTDNVRINLRQNTRLFQYALSDREEPVRLTDGFGSSINHVSRDRGDHTIEVSAIRGETFCDRHGVVPEVVKLDVEGHEFEVLSGFGACLARVDVLLVEMNGLSDLRGAGASAIHQLLRTSGLQGPWRCQFDRSTLVGARGGDREDCVCLSPARLEDMKACGWRSVERA